MFVGQVQYYGENLTSCLYEFSNTDYVLIPGGSLTGLNQDKRFSLDRFCGTTLGVCGTTTSAEQTCGKIPGPVTSKLNKNSKIKQKQQHQTKNYKMCQKLQQKCKI